ncbi:MAG: VWA domain-containing protein [Spirochaetales bacterium]|nr:VWA domain-containing protein [Spirochaetales bacterium]
MNYQDFSASSVTWGYRDIFAETIKRLFNEGYLGPEREELTRHFFSLLQCSKENLYDHVLKEFLDSLTGPSAWIFDLPAIFGEIIRIGSQFSEAKMFYGIEYYRILKDGGFGDSPEKVQFLLTWLRKLAKIDIELGFSFLQGYGFILQRLLLSEIPHYAEEGIRIFKESTKAGLRFMECKLASSEAYILELTRETRLLDVSESLERLLLMLTGKNIPIEPAGLLERETLRERGTSVICLYGWLFLPERMRKYPDQEANKREFLLMAVSAAAMYRCRSFPVLHGRKGYAVIDDLIAQETPHSIAYVNVLTMLECARVFLHIADCWPGAKPMIRRRLQEELESCRPGGDMELFFYRLLMSAIDPTVYREHEMIPYLLRTAAESMDIVSSLKVIYADDSKLLQEMQTALPEIGTSPVTSISFLPDFHYPAIPGDLGDYLSKDLDGSVGEVNDNADLDDELVEMMAEFDDMDSDSTDADTEIDLQDPEQPGLTDNEQGTDVSSDARKSVPFLYDEWSSDEGTYYRDFCSLFEDTPEVEGDYSRPDAAREQVERVRRIFEMLKPAAANKMKRLSEGDGINHDLLIQYLVDSKRDPSPKIDFYERTKIERRDLSVMVLLDVSGSTDEMSGGQRILDIETQAALIFGEGLMSLGDRFSICGFSSNGRQNCRYFVYKDFHDDWDSQAVGRLFSAVPSSSTRIGAALRHAGSKLRREVTRRMLIILVTDGRPMDQGYDPETRYAQHDVRMACEENRKAGIHTFCVSTMENSRADMEIMFPERKFVILKDITELPRILPRLYIHLTT